GAAATAAGGEHVAALRQRCQRLAEGRARDAHAGAELSLGGELGARREQPELDRRAEAVDGLLEGCLGANGSEDRLGRREHPGLSRALLGRGDLDPAGHSRSNPRKRSQSVTAEPKAASSTSAALR